MISNVNLARKQPCRACDSIALFSEVVGMAADKR